LRYYPLVKKIAKYFHKRTQNVELEDLIQEGWIGMLLGLKKYDPKRNTSIGAFCNKYIFGRIYRSQLGTKNLIHNKKIITIDAAEKIIDRIEDNKEFIFFDYIDNNYDETTAELLKMHYKGYRKTEIMKKLGLTPDLYNKIINDFDANI
jgi:hypothetical protein